MYQRGGTEPQGVQSITGSSGVLWGCIRGVAQSPRVCSPLLVVVGSSGSVSEGWHRVLPGFQMEREILCIYSICPLDWPQHAMYLRSY